MRSQLSIQCCLAVEIYIIFNHNLSFSFSFPPISANMQISNEEKLPVIIILIEIIFAITIVIIIIIQYFIVNAMLHLLLEPETTNT